MSWQMSRQRVESHLLGKKVKRENVGEFDSLIDRFPSGVTSAPRCLTAPRWMKYKIYNILFHIPAPLTRNSFVAMPVCVCVRVFAAVSLEHLPTCWCVANPQQIEKHINTNKDECLCICSVQCLLWPATTYIICHIVHGI